MKFVFTTTHKTPTGPGSFRMTAIEVYARNVDVAWTCAEPQIPVGEKVWCWYTEPENACTMCFGPFHGATGHWESEKRHWCGPCARSMLLLLKSYLPRRWGGLRFYDHALVPK